MAVVEVGSGRMPRDRRKACSALCERSAVPLLIIGLPLEISARPGGWALVRSGSEFPARARSPELPSCADARGSALAPGVVGCAADARTSSPPSNSSIDEPRLRKSHDLAPIAARKAARVFAGGSVVLPALVTPVVDGS